MHTFSSCVTNNGCACVLQVEPRTVRRHRPKQHMHVSSAWRTLQPLPWHALC